MDIDQVIERAIAVGLVIFLIGTGIGLLYVLSQAVVCD